MLGPKSKNQDLQVSTDQSFFIEQQWLQLHRELTDSGSPTVDSQWNPSPFFLKSRLIRWVRSLCLCLSVKLRFAYVKQCVEKCDHCSLDSSHIVAFGSKSALFPKAIKNALMRNTVAQCDTFLLWHKHSHSSLFWVSPACTILLNSSPRLNIDASFLPLDKNDTSSFKKIKTKTGPACKEFDFPLMGQEPKMRQRYTESTGTLKVTCLFGFTVTRE